MHSTARFSELRAAEEYRLERDPGRVPALGALQERHAPLFDAERIGELQRADSGPEGTERRARRLLEFLVEGRIALRSARRLDQPCWPTRRRPIATCSTGRRGGARAPAVRLPSHPASPGRMGLRARRLAGPALALALTACSGARAAPAPDGATPRGRFEVVGRGPVTRTHTTDLWVFQGVDGRDYAYTGTWGNCGRCYGDRMYAWDVTDPARPVLTDSVVVDARVVNDVKVNREGTLAVLTREGASDRRNGIVVLDLADPAHPTVRSVFTETLSGGVHNTFIDGHHVYAVHDGTSDLHVIDISDPGAPRQVGRWGIRRGFGKYLHDVWVVDGLAYLSYWDDGLVVLDVGKGLRGGRPSAPVLVSQLRYRTRVGSLQYGNTHVAFPYTNRAGRSYVFVGDEIFPPEFDITRQTTPPAGFIRVIDVTDVQRPVETARYRLPNAGAHNLWAEGDVLYLAYYNAGLRAVDVSGELVGDLRSQGREIAVLETGDADAFLRDRAFTWGAMPYEGHLFASDFNSGLWVTRLVRPSPAAAN